MIPSYLITVFQSLNITGAVYGIDYKIIDIIKIPCPNITESRTVNIARILGILSQPVIEIGRIKSFTKLIAYILFEYIRIFVSRKRTCIISPFQKHINVIAFVELSLNDLCIIILENISNINTAVHAPFHKIGNIITLVKLFLNHLGKIFTEHLTDLETRCFCPFSQSGKVVALIEHGFQTCFYIFREYISGLFACLLPYFGCIGKFGNEIIDSSLTCGVESKFHIRTYLFHTVFESLRKIFLGHIFNVGDTAFYVIEYLLYISISFLGHSRLSLFELIVIAYGFTVISLCLSNSA